MPLEAMCASVEDLRDRVASLVVPAVDRASFRTPLSMKYHSPFKAREILQTGLRRCLQFTDAACLEMNGRLYLPPFLSARAALETGCVMLDLWHRVRDAIKDPEHLRFDTLREHLRRLAFGTRAKHRRSFGRGQGQWPTTPAAREIMERVAKADADFYAELGVVLGPPQETDLLPLYADLSDVGHPNSSGMFGAFAGSSIATGAGRLVNQFKDPWERYAALLSRPLLGLSHALLHADLATRSVELMMDSFVLACEADVHRRGEWPADIPYPVPRA